MSVRQLAYEFFDSTEMRTLFMRACTTSTGCYADDVMGLNGLLHVLPLVFSYELQAIAVGASQTLSDALRAAGSKHGVEYSSSPRLTRILVSGTKATGVKLKNGTTVKADLVVSNLGLPQTILRLMREVSIDPKMERRLKAIQYDRSQVFWVNVAMHEAPQYKAAETNPGIGPQPRLLWGPKDPDYLATRYQAELYLHGHSSKICAFTACGHAFDHRARPKASISWASRSSPRPAVCLAKMNGRRSR